MPARYSSTGLPWIEGDASRSATGAYYPQAKKPEIQSRSIAARSSAW
jgi:hypothetical protein